jgi:hypothetical protein
MFVSKAKDYLKEAPGFWPYPQTLDKAVTAFQGQTLQLIINIGKLKPYKVLRHWPRGKCYKTLYDCNL